MIASDLSVSGVSVPSMSECASIPSYRADQSQNQMYQK